MERSLQRGFYRVANNRVFEFIAHNNSMKIQLYITLCMCTYIHYIAFAEDTVIYQNSVTGRQVKSVGAIENYTRDELILRTQSGNILSIKSDSIIDITADRPSLYLEAELRMSNQEFEKALSLLEQALVQVPDGWMKHEILARQVECLYNLNRSEEAAVRYVQLVQLESNSAFYDCVPLVWTSVELSTRTQQLAQNWIRQQKYPYVTLLGASLLLTTDNKNEVQRALNALVKSDDPDIAIMAQMQLNRLSLTPMPETTLKNLEKKIDILPKSLQYGPRFVLAQLWSRSSVEGIKVDKTTLNYLQCAFNPKTPAELQARSFYSAGATLLSADRRDEAFRIFNRLIEKYPDSQWTQQAKRTAGGNL